MTDIDKRIDEIKVGFDIGRTDEDESCATFMRGDTVIGILYGDAARYVKHLQAQVAERDNEIKHLKATIMAIQSLCCQFEGGVADAIKEFTEQSINKAGE